MRLADHILAARNTVNDIGRIATYMGGTIEEAQRFELHDDVALAAFQLLTTRPSTLVAALPLCRLPYPIMWIEWRGGMMGTPKRDFKVAPEPVKEGVLIEEIDHDLQVGCVTMAWMHRRSQLQPTSSRVDALLDEKQMVVNICPLGVYFDFSGRKDVRTVIRTIHEIMADRATSPRDPALIAALEAQLLRPASVATLAEFVSHRKGWERLADKDAEIRALQSLESVMLPGLSKHGWRLVDLLVQKAPMEAMAQMMRNWFADIEGEGTFVQCVLAILNSKTRVIDHRTVDLRRLYRARQRRGRRPMVTYSVTHLRMSRAQRNVADAAGISREEARQHMVRGHFKIRRTGVFWWSSFLRGDASRPVHRRQYEVAT